MNPGPPAVLLLGSSFYIPGARRLCEEVRRFHPDWPVFLCLIDHQETDLCSEPFQLVKADWLNGKEGALLRFQYEPIEICGTGRPRAILNLFELGYSRVLYLDLDISVHGYLDPILEALEKNCIAITPHLLEPSAIGRTFEEENQNRLTGLSNAGCLAVRDCPESRIFLEWWTERTNRHGYKDTAAGYFNEQSWLDAALSYFPGAAFIRHKGVNVAWWNLGERPLEKHSNGSYTAGGDPLLLFHWSGYRLSHPEQLTRHKLSMGFETPSPLTELAQNYRSSLQRFCSSTFEEDPSYSYRRLSDGTLIHRSWREAVRQRLPGLEIPDDPFLATRPWLKQLRAAESKTRHSRLDWLLEHARENPRKRRRRYRREQMKQLWAFVKKPFLQKS